jgi:hypothetical protein
MFKRNAFAALTLLFGLINRADSANYWQGVNGPVILGIDSTKVTIKFEDGVSPAGIGCIERLKAPIAPTFLLTRGRRDSIG